MKMTHDPEKHAPTKRVLAIRRAAVAFANDYGPLAKANAGDEEAQHIVAGQLISALRAQGLIIKLKSH